VWLVHLVRHLAGRFPIRGWGGVLSWSLIPVLGVAVTVLYHTRAPLVARVLLSEEALLALVEEAESAPQRIDGVPELDWPRRAGTILVEGAFVQERCVFLLTDRAPVGRSYDLVFVRDGGRPEGEYRFGETRFDHVVGRWWTFAG
jgi:hypothetical protein